MKKLTSLAPALALLLALFACGKAAVAVPNAPLILGEKYLLDLDYDQAILQFEQAIVIEPKNPRPYVGQMVVWAADPGRPESPPAWPKLPGLPTLPDGARKPEDILPVIFNWYKTRDLPDFLRKLIDALLRQWPDAQWLKDELGKLNGTEQPTESTTKENPKAKPPLIKITGYSADGTQINYYVTFEYNSDGTIKRRNEYNADGTLSIYSTCEYNSDEILKRYNWYDADGTLGHYFTYEYNSDGTKKESAGYNADGTQDSYGTWEYNVDGTEKKTEQYNMDGALQGYSTYEYNSDGTLKTTNAYGADGALNSYHIREYNSDGTAKRTNIYSSDGTLSGYNTCEYGTW